MKISNYQVLTKTAAVNETPTIPVWAEAPFKCLLVKSAGVNFIIPALSISYIKHVNKNIIRIPFDVVAFRGVIALRGKSLAVIDLFTLLTESTDKNIQSLQVTSMYIKYVLVIEDASCALACDQVSEMLTLTSEEVTLE